MGLVVIGGGLGTLISNVEEGTEKIKQTEQLQDIKEQITSKIDSKVAQVDDIIHPTPKAPEIFGVCSGNTKCITDKVTKIVDGDTIYTESYQIRLSLTNTPEKDEPGFAQAASFTAMSCPVGSMIRVDQDDLQPYDVYDRLLGKVYCGDKALNSELLYSGHANILTQYCSTSEFSGEDWAQSYGCGVDSVSKSDVPVNPDTVANCDPSYPDVCIRPYPPDLDCGEISFKNFRVVGSDPHRFDGNKDGIGCES